MRTKVLDLELRNGTVDPISVRYDAARFLVRDVGVPLGFLQVDRGAVSDRTPLRDWAVDAVEWTLWQRTLAARLAPIGAVDMPPISVIVCTRDRPEALVGCLEALVRQDYPAFEVIVVDNAPSDDRTRTVVDSFPVRYERELRPGLDWARNCGLAAATHELVAYTDDDARPDAGWLAAIARGFASPDVAALTGLVVPAELETDAQRLFEDAYGGMGKGFRLKLHSGRGKRPTFTPNLYGTGCNMAFRREALNAIGGFDPALDVGTATGGGGDLDAFQRLLEAGAAIVYRPDVLVRHIHRRTVAGLRKQLFDNGRAYSAVLWKCFRRARGIDRVRVLRSYARWFWSWHLRRAFRRLRRREAMPLSLIRAELAGGLIGPFAYARAQREAARLSRGDEA